MGNWNRFKNRHKNGRYSRQQSLAELGSFAQDIADEIILLVDAVESHKKGLIGNVHLYNFLEKLVNKNDKN